MPNYECHLIVAGLIGRLNVILSKGFHASKSRNSELLYQFVQGVHECKRWETSHALWRSYTWNPRFSKPLSIDVDQRCIYSLCSHITSLQFLCFSTNSMSSVRVTVIIEPLWLVAKKIVEVNSGQCRRSRGMHTWSLNTAERSSSAKRELAVSSLPCGHCQP